MSHEKNLKSDNKRFKTQIIASFNPANYLKSEMQRALFARAHLPLAFLASKNVLSPTKRIPRTFHGARHAP